MAYDFSKFKAEAKKAEEWLKNEFGSLNTGRATPSVLDAVQIEVYGSRMPISHLAAVSIEDPRTLKIAPYDPSQAKDIEKGIMAANLGVSVSAAEGGVRVSFPQPTTEGRMKLVKVLKEKLEHAKVSVRGEREKLWNDIQEKEKDGKISEDEKFKGKNELQKLTDEANKNLETIFEKKEKEVLG